MAPDVAEDVGGQRTLRVATQLDPGGVDRGELGRAFEQVDLELGADVLHDRHRLEQVVALVGQAGPDVVDLHRHAGLVEGPGQADEQVVTFGVAGNGLELAAVDGDDDRLPVVDQDLAVAVEDPAPLALVGDGAEDLAAPHLLDRAGIEDLEVVEAGEQGGEQRQGHDPDRRHPHPGRLVVHASGVPGPPSRRIMTAASSAHAEARPPVRPTAKRRRLGGLPSAGPFGGQRGERPARDPQGGQGQDAVHQPPPPGPFGPTARRAPGPDRGRAPRRPTARRPPRWPA